MPPSQPLEQPLQRFEYRPALDGLRALAVLPVLFYHADLPGASGGFLGVDLFFVLSGYLITSLLVIEARGTGKIILTRFWLRRVRRLLPALLAMLLLISFYVEWRAFPQDFARIRSDGLATLGYVANWWYIYGGQSYFDQFNVSPLRHTWSLGIEEQWYLFWPILLGLAFRGRNLESMRLAQAAALAALISLGLMALLFDPAQDPSRVYYGTDTHAHGLLIGAALAFWLAGERAPRFSRSQLNGMGLAGACVFLVFVFAVNDTTAWMYRGGFGVIALSSACMIAACTLPGGNRLESILSWAPLVYVGRISYGLYLYHWPIYVIVLPDLVGFDGAPLTALRIALSFGLAIVSFHVLEMPVRRSGIDGARALATALVPVAGVSLVLISVTSLPTLNPSERFIVTKADPRLSGGKLRVALIGDSVAGSLGEHFDPAWAPKIAVSSKGWGGCGIMTGELPIEGRPARVTHCDNWEWGFRNSVVTLLPRFALLSIGNWEQFDRVVDGELLKVGSTRWKQYFLGQLRKAMKALRVGGTKQVAIVTRPCTQPMPMGLRKRRGLVAPPDAIQAVNDVLVHFAKRSDAVGLIDLANEMCPNGRLVSAIDGARIYSDGVHFTEAGSRLAWQFLGPEILRVWDELSARSQGTDSVEWSTSRPLRLRGRAALAPGPRDQTHRMD